MKQFSCAPNAIRTGVSSSIFYLYGNTEANVVVAGMEAGYPAPVMLE